MTANKYSNSKNKYGTGRDTSSFHVSVTTALKRFCGDFFRSSEKYNSECYNTDRKITLLWDLLSVSFAALVSQGLVEQGKVCAYDAPCVREIEEEVRREGSFSLDYARTYEANLSGSGDARRDRRTASMAVRGIQESMLSHHFGREIVDALFHKYAELVTGYMEREEVKCVQIGVVLARL